MADHADVRVIEDTYAVGKPIAEEWTPTFFARLLMDEDMEWFLQCVQQGAGFATRGRDGLTYELWPATFDAAISYLGELAEVLTSGQTFL